jgi:hypothetical protein
MNRVFKDMFGKELDQVAAVGQIASKRNRSGGRARAVVRRLAAVAAVALLGACSPQQGAWMTNVAPATINGSPHLSANGGAATTNSVAHSA